MEFLRLCCVVPHPPILVPEVGKSEVARLEQTTMAMEELAGEIDREKPETLVVISPHTPIYPDAFTVKGQSGFSGSLATFGAPQVKLEYANNLELAEALIATAGKMDIPVNLTSGSRLGGNVAELDHGMMVPLYFIGDPSYRLVSISMSMASYWTHYRLGMAIREAVEKSTRRAVYVASGDLSHRLKPGAPAGYSPRAVDFDEQIVAIMNSGDFGLLFELDESLVEDAGECGLRPIFTLAGAMDGYDVSSRAMSYEGPFGVGYMVAMVRPDDENHQRSIAPPTGR